MGTAIIALASLATTAVSTGISVYSQRQQAKSQRYAEEYNAKLAENEARNVQLEAAERGKRQRQQAGRHMATLRNNLAAGGTLTTGGTSLELLAENAAHLDLAIGDAARESRIEAAAWRSRADMSLWNAAQHHRAGTLGTWSTALGGLAGMAGDYAGFRYEGVFTPTTTRTKKTW